MTRTAQRFVQERDNMYVNKLRGKNDKHKRLRGRNAFISSDRMRIKFIPICSARMMRAQRITSSICPQFP